MAALREGARAPYRVAVTEGPWFDNNLATLEVRGRGLVMRWDTGEVRGERYDAARLDRSRASPITDLRPASVTVAADLSLPGHRWVAAVGLGVHSGCGSGSNLNVREHRRRPYR